MTTDIQSSLRRRLESPTVGETVTLIIGVTDSESAAVMETVESTGADVGKRLPHDYLAVTTSEVDIAALCSLDVVTSVSMEGEGTTLESGDSSSSDSAHLTDGQ